MTIVALIVGIALALLAPRMAPVQLGTSLEFWKVASGVSLDPNVTEVIGSAYFVDNEWVAYECHHIHGSDIYYVPTKDVAAEFDAVVESLKLANEKGEDSIFVKGYKIWAAENEESSNIESLLRSIRTARIESFVAEDPELAAYAIYGEYEFWERWQRSDHYWAAISFEWLYLSGLALFAVWPGIVNGSLLRWSCHLGFVPLLFMMPAYLGYASFSFTSAGPVGGVLYPYLFCMVRGGSVNGFDESILARVPQVLEPLYAPIGSPMALTGMGIPGPTSAIVFGVVVATLVLILGIGVQRWRNRPPMSVQEHNSQTEP